MSGVASNAESVQRLGESLGFELIGITPAAPSAFAEQMHAWLAAGKQGEMGYLARNILLRLDPAELVPGARSVIVVADFYAKPSSTEGMVGGPDAPVGRIARYARGDDYHRVIKKRLHALADSLRGQFPGETFRVAVDTAPVLEREHASRAGLGWVGKHTLLIHPKKGSWMLLGVIVTSLVFEDTTDARRPAAPVTGPSHCGTCTRCIDACPTDCITPYSVDASHCISYLTLEHRGPIDPALHRDMGDWVAGCDVCQEVCPFNQASGDRGHISEGGINPAYAPRPEFDPGPPLLDLLGWSAEDRQNAFIKSALKRVKLDMINRNALIAAGNHLVKHHDGPLLERVQLLADDEAEPELVRETAKQVLAALATG